MTQTRARLITLVAMSEMYSSVALCLRGESIPEGLPSFARLDSRGRLSLHARPANYELGTTTYVPSDQLARYSSCSGVSRSILMLIDSSFSLATHLSSSSGTR
jgi:hypothetical protein